MRVSTAQQQAMVLQDLQNISQHQLEGWNQVATGKQITQPAKAPGSWTQLQSVNREISQTGQYLNSITALTSQFQMEDTLLQSYTGYLQDIRALVLQANNPGLAAVDLATLGQQVVQWRNAIIGLLNSRDAEGYYLFAGSRTSTPPVTVSTASDGNESFVFNNNNDIRQITVASDITMSSTDSAESLCFTVDDGGSGFNVILMLGQIAQTLQAPPANLSTLLAGYLVQLDQAQNQAGSVHAALGTRMKALDGIRSDLHEARLYFQEQAGQLGDLDYISAISHLNQQKVQYEAALKGLSEVANLSLFDYL
ncbi:flagellin N-terminal helical domain-containing protein [Endozoicomonas acroporae]|uniref:flagellin N-terminal helical domain-containing protein n=1 Tax=Endozoicomonas acroporae TaxID=1701104 RepID=UPI000C78A6C5|nr:flagellin [Endozoicomonas acroporae]